MSAATTKTVTAVMPREVTRHVPSSVQNMLWGRAAGRCEFSGCNEPLWKSPTTQEGVNVAEKAHIYSFSEGGPRGHARVAPDALNDLGNLILVCHACHRKIDRRQDGGRYTPALLLAWKREHERRIEIATGVAPDKGSHVVLYGANVGEHSSPLAFDEAAAAMFPDRYPASDVPIELSTINSSFQDRDAGFWAAEAENLRRKFNQRIRERVALGDVPHLSVFGLAPQPLLVLFGTLLGDIVPMDVFQRHREPPTWQWPAPAFVAPFEVQSPRSTSGPAALVLAISGHVTTDRITSVLGPEARIWTVTTAMPHNDVMKSRPQLSQLRRLLRAVLDQVKASAGQTTTLHVFPAAPVSAAIELGRVRMPKADMPWKVYDQVSARGGFIPVLSISDGGQ